MVSGRRSEHIYRGKGGEQSKKEFEERYGKKKGDYVRGAKIGEIYRKQHHGLNWNQVRRPSRRRRR